jgi:hypothetical protein
VTRYRYRRYRRQRLSGGQVAAIALAAVVALGGTAGTKAALSHAAAGSAPASSAARVAWARALLRLEGLPRTWCEVATIVAWEGAENSPASWHNPLDTTRAEPGSVSVNSAPVQAYVSRSQGLAATDATLHNGLYGPVLTALGEGGGQPAADAVAASP